MVDPVFQFEGLGVRGSSIKKANHYFVNRAGRGSFGFSLHLSVNVHSAIHVAVNDAQVRSILTRNLFSKFRFLIHFRLYAPQNQIYLMIGLDSSHSVVHN